MCLFWPFSLMQIARARTQWTCVPPHLLRTWVPTGHSERDRDFLANSLRVMKWNFTFSKHCSHKATRQKFALYHFYCGTHRERIVVGGRYRERDWWKLHISQTTEVMIPQWIAALSLCYCCFCSSGERKKTRSRTPSRPINFPRRIFSSRGV